MRKYLILTIVILLFGVGLLFQQNKELQNERDRQSGNVETLMTTVKKYKYADSLNAASVSALNLNIDELKKYRADDAILIKELGVKNKNLEAIMKVSIHTFDTIFREYWHPSPDRSDCLEYKDKWSHVVACFKDSTLYFSNRDSLIAIIHRIPKRKFLWWSWGTKGYKLELVNFNPKSEFDYSSFVKVKK